MRLVLHVDVVVRCIGVVIECVGEAAAHETGIGMRADELKHELPARSAADFDSLWRRDLHWLDEPNRRGKGTSRVGLADAGAWPELGTTGRVYVKRQQAFFCRPAWNAFRRTPTLRREARFIAQARVLGVNVPEVVLYQEGSDDRALLVLREIDGAVDLEQSLLSLDMRERLDLFKNIGKTLAKLHSARIMHGAVYPKHVLVEVGSPRVWLIDLEKARRVPFRSSAATRDIARLVRHAPFMTDADLDALVSAYDARAFPGLLERLKR